MIRWQHNRIPTGPGHISHTPPALKSRTESGKHVTPTLEASEAGVEVAHAQGVMELLEREGCLRDLRVALQDAGGGAGRVALVSGEAGIGKTTLVEQFVRQHASGMHVLWGACDALFTPRPLGPLHDMAPQAHGDWEVLLTPDPDRGTILSAVLAELQQRPTIAVFEDVHWADEATLDLLRFVGRRIMSTSALLIVTYRDEELGPHHPLRMVLGDMASSPAVRRIPLPLLSEQAVRVLVGERAIDAVTLHHKTGGNPFFVTEVLSNAGAGLPPTVRDAVHARAARLSPSALTVLHAGAVIGPRIEAWLLAEVAGADAQAADECLAVGMLVEQGECLAFRHELARQTILESISPTGRIALHRMTLDALRAHPATRGDPVRLAHHAEGAGDHEAVLAHAPAAARQAAAASAHRSAAALYALALRHAGDYLPPDSHAGLLEAYAEQCDYVGRQTEGITARWEAVDIWRKLGNSLKQGENLASLMRMLSIVGQSAEAQQVSQASIEILEALPPGRGLALAYRVRATQSLVERDTDEALAWAEKALSLAEQFQDAEVLAAVHSTIGTCWLFLDYERGCSYLERCLAMAADAGVEGRVAHIYTNLGSGSGELHRFHSAARYLARGISYAAARDLDTHRLYMLAWQAVTDLYLGRWREAGETAAEVLHMSGATANSRITALVALGRLRARQGDSSHRATLDEALELATCAGNLQRLGPVRAARAEAAWLAGDHNRALEEARAIYDMAVEKRHPWIAGELAFWRWRAGEEIVPASWFAKPFALNIAGAWHGAADEWQRLGCPYEQARALADGDTAAQATALAIFKRLGAWSASDVLRRRMRAEGTPHIPRGPRPATRKHPFCLTAREIEVLGLLAEDLTNSEIAARLHLSAKTVDHHVSAILTKLQVHSRIAAAAIARQELLTNPK